MKFFGIWFFEQNLWFCITVCKKVSNYVKKFDALALVKRLQTEYLALEQKCKEFIFQYFNHENCWWLLPLHIEGWLFCSLALHLVVSQCGKLTLFWTFSQNPQIPQSFFKWLDTVFSARKFKVLYLDTEKNENLEVRARKFNFQIFEQACWFSVSTSIKDRKFG